MRLLDEQHGLTITEEIARDDVSDHVDHVAEMMRIGRRAAKHYVTEDVIQGLADHIAECIESHRAAIECGEVTSLDAKRQRRPRGLSDFGG